MNEILADLTVLWNKSRTYHYNIVGVDFRSVHEALDEEIENLGEWIDQVAENMKAEGQIPYGTLKDMLENSHIDEVEARDFSSEEVYGQLADDYIHVVKEIRMVKEISNGARVNVLEDIEVELMKKIWFFQSALKKPLYN